MSNKESTKPAALPPVRTREDCFSWVVEADLEVEVWAAFRAAVRHYKTYDFEAECASRAAEEGRVDGFIPDTVLCRSDGEPWVGCASFWDDLVHLVLWRVLAYGERKGVTSDSFDFDLPSDCLTASDVFKHPYWGPILGGEASTMVFKTKREALAYMRAHGINKLAPAGVATTTEAVTNVKRTNDDGTNCRG